MSDLNDNEKRFLVGFIKYCYSKGIAYRGTNEEQMEAHMLNYINENGYEVEVIFDPDEGMIIKVE